MRIRGNNRDARVARAEGAHGHAPAAAWAAAASIAREMGEAKAPFGARSGPHGIHIRAERSCLNLTQAYKVVRITPPQAPSCSIFPHSELIIWSFLNEAAFSF